MDHHKLDKLANAGIVAGCVAGVLCSAALLIEMGRAAGTLERSKQAAAAPAQMPEEDPAEDALIEEALLEQGYYRDDVPLPYELQDALHTACQEFGVRYELSLAVIERDIPV